MSEEYGPVPAATDWEAIGRYLAGESDSAESEVVEAWLSAHAGDAALVSLLNRRAASFGRTADGAVDAVIDIEAALRAVRRGMANEQLPSPVLRVESGGAARTKTRTPSGPTARLRRWRVAGIAAAALVAAVAISQFRSPVPTPREYRTAVGQRDSVRLSDGSRVVLAPGSRLLVAASFGADARDVTLEGAAFFEVVHDDARPFTVHAGETAIRDIGTAFSVKTGLDGVISVAVTHGIVSVGNAATPSPVELREGDRGVVTGGQVAVARGVVTKEEVAWTQGQLAYRDAPLSEVRADLTRWYGVDLEVPDSVLATRTLTASFRGDSADQVLRLIALAMGAELVSQGDRVLLVPQGTPPLPPRP